ncbi:hypothetical protein BH24ACT26_BH24ACT26_06080 [soil metagenome]
MAGTGLVHPLSPARGADPSPPSVRLLGAVDHVTLHARTGKVPLELGVWVAASGGDFELRVARPNYDSPAGITQVDARTGRELRSLSPELLKGWAGLRRFLRVTFRDKTGTVVVNRHFAFCPNKWDRQRVSDQGPAASRYPSLCASSAPFTKGMVWGIDEHWASIALGDDYRTPSVRVADGAYSVTVRIADPYAEMLSISEESRKTTVDVTVKSSPHRRAPTVVTGAKGTRAARQEGVPTVTDPDPSTLPDLVAGPAWNIGVSSKRGRDLLFFAATPWNSGPAPLVVEGFRRAGEDVMDAYQYFHNAQGEMVGRAPVGDFRYDGRRKHHHWHFLQFADYALLDASRRVLSTPAHRSGRPGSKEEGTGNSSREEIVRSTKQAFCIVPTDAIDLTVAGANWTPWALERFSICGSPTSLWVRQVLEAGWGDTYFQFVPGQSFDITDLPNGRYHIRVRVNGPGALYERSKWNNSELRLVRLRGRPGHRRVGVAPWHGIDG